MSSHALLDKTLARLEVYGVRLGLETTKRLLAALGNPEHGYPTVLIAGTNGKGSTAALLAAVAATAGYRTGLYTSPHLESVCERIRVDGVAVAPQVLDDAVGRVIAAAEQSLGYLPTYFEVLTAAALSIFGEVGIDLAVLEVGLGGRLDATNATEPILSLITGIGLEHEQFLGSSLGSIAREKAGIMRSGRPTLAWVEQSEARAAVVEVARQVGAQLTVAQGVVRVESLMTAGARTQRIMVETDRHSYALETRLLGEHQARNAGLVTLAGECLAEMGFAAIGPREIQRGAETLVWPGRLEWVDLPDGGPVLLDVAHNPDGVASLVRYLGMQSSGYTLVFGALSDKRVDRMLPDLARRAGRIILTAPASDRCLSPHDLVRHVADAGCRVVVEAERENALRAALHDAAPFILCCGSLYLVGDVRRRLRQRFGVPADTHVLRSPAVDRLQSSSAEG